MTEKEFLEKSDFEFYAWITLVLAVILGLLGVIFVGSGFAHIITNPADAVFRFAFGGALTFGAGKLFLARRFPDLIHKAILGESEGGGDDD